MGHDDGNEEHLDQTEAVNLAYQLLYGEIGRLGQDRAEQRTSRTNELPSQPDVSIPDLEISLEVSRGADGELVATFRANGRTEKLSRKSKGGIAHDAGMLIRELVKQL